MAGKRNARNKATMHTELVSKIRMVGKVSCIVVFVILKLGKNYADFNKSPG